MVKDWGNKPICRIDVTGFLSIQVALLVLFMTYYGTYDDLPTRVTVDLFKARHSINMPAADHEDALIVSVMRDGKTYFGSEAVRSADRLRQKLQDRIRTSSEKRVYIKADARAKYRAVNWVLGQIRRAGIEKVSFLTQPSR